MAHLISEAQRNDRAKLKVLAAIAKYGVATISKFTPIFQSYQPGAMHRTIDAMVEAGEIVRTPRPPGCSGRPCFDYTLPGAK